MRGRTATGHQNRTHCKNGHALVGDNIIWRASGGRLCKTCAHMRMERSRLAIAARRAKETEEFGGPKCKRGHIMAGDNLEVEGAPGKRQRRRCRICRDQSRAAAAERKREQRPAEPYVEYLPIGGGTRGVQAQDLRKWDGSACAGLPLDLFFARDGEAEDAPAARHVATAYRFCGGCPLLDVCGKEASEARDTGLRAGKWRYVNWSAGRYETTDILNEEYPA